MTLKQLNERHRRFYDNSRNKLVAELPASRFTIETTDGLHRVYDSQPSEGESNPLGDINASLAEQEKQDRAAVNDAALSMPIRLAALNRLNAQKRKV